MSRNSKLKNIDRKSGRRSRKRSTTERVVITSLGDFWDLIMIEKETLELHINLRFFILMFSEKIQTTTKLWFRYLPKEVAPHTQERRASWKNYQSTRTNAWHFEVMMSKVLNSLKWATLTLKLLSNWKSKQF